MTGADEEPPQNPDILVGANDLTSLSYLHEEAVLTSLRVRFLDQNAIYTWCGIVLVAVNPFSDLEIYGDETIQTYHESMGNAQLDPHIYAVAEDAFSKLERESRNQSIIVSGESGAGKTVSAKFAMRYFASIAGSLSTTNVENKVLASNPIMEAIGNAKTTRNDNSSRFGKYIQIILEPQKRTIIGGHMRTYLLEKSRVSKQSDGERNFHIFYQICSYAQSQKKDELRLNNWNFAYLGANQQPSASDDIAKFNEAMNTLGFTERQQNVIYRIVAAILHAGNIQFSRVDDESCKIAQDSYHLESFCQLLGLDESATRSWLTQRVLRTGMKEVIVTPVNKDIAEQGRDALAKYIYEKMFAWVVALINRALGTAAEQSTTFIGVLDIYGFEHFDINSFEQFCINYANEVLQQQFNQHVFKLEQEEYIREGIDWTFVTFTDNQPVIDLIESRLGLLSLLDEECKMPRGTAESWCLKLYSQIKTGDIFQKPKIGYQRSFIIQHFTNAVTYTVDGFLEKNRDTVWEEQIDLLKRSNMLDNVFADDVAADMQPKSGGGKVKITPQQQQSKQSKQAKATVGSQFRESLRDLMQTLNATTPHYVRCIKSNDDKAAFDFDNDRVVQQLRACGVLETIRISANGFPSRWTYQDFANRYRVLLVGVSKVIKKQRQVSGEPPVPVPRKLVRAGSSSTSELRAICEQIVKVVYELKVYSKFNLPFEEQQLQKEQVQYQFGKSKIFFRAGQVALLERIRSARLRECAILIQRIVKGWLCRKRYIKIKHAVTRLQTHCRGFLARRLYRHLKTSKAATVIQTNWRRYCQRKKYLSTRSAIIGLQCFGRGLLARRRFRHIREHNAASRIQQAWRGYLARKAYRKKLRQIVIVQSAVRRHFAKKVLKQLRVEAKSVAHVTQLNKGLERKIFELQTKIENLNGDLAKARSSEVKVSRERSESQRLEMELKNLKNLLSDKEKDYEQLQAQLEQRTASYAGMERQLADSHKVIEKLKEVNKNMEHRFDSKAVDEAVAEKEKGIVAKFEREKKILMEERESEKYAHQQLLRKYAALEDRLHGEENGIYSDDRSPDMTTVSMMMRCSELEQECAKLKHENQQMREVMADVSDQKVSDSAASLLAQQCAAMQLELDRTREEKTHLKTIVLGQEGSIGRQEHGDDSEVISAFKALLKQMERELEAEKAITEQFRTEIMALKRDNDRQQQLIGINNSALLENSSSDDIVTRLNQENMLLREKNEKLSNDYNKMRLDMMRIKLLENGNGNDNSGYDEVGGDERGKNYMGMFKYNPLKENLLLSILITELDPGAALKFSPHLPAYVLFMCIRYTDEVNDDNQVRTLLNNTILAVKRTVKRAAQQQKLDVLILWLSNVCKIITLLKQYSGDEEVFGILEESLKNFDLSEYRQMFSDVAIWIYQGVIKQSEDRIQPLIVPAVLEHEGLASSGIYSRPAQRSGSISDDSLPSSPSEKPVDALIKELSNLHKLLLLHVVESELIAQIFKQLFYFICAGALNNLLLRKDLCHWNKAMQIRFNLSALEQWCREQQVPRCNEIVEKLDPIIQATKLLQTKKTEEHINTIVEMCNKLSSSQILKILNLYTAGDEETISNTFIKKMQQHLNEHRRESGTSLLMDTKYAFAVTIPYNASDIDFKRITLPQILLKKGIGTVLVKI